MSFSLVLRRFVAALVGAALALPLAAQEWAGPAALEVRVEDAKGHSVEGAEVALEYINVESASVPAPVVTGADGRCAIGGLAPGAWSIEVRKPGYMSYRAEILVALEGKPEVVAASQHNVPGAVSTMRVRLGRAKSAPLAKPAVVVVQAPPPAPAPTPAGTVSEAPAPDAKDGKLSSKGEAPSAPIATPAQPSAPASTAAPAPAMAAAAAPEAKNEKRPSREETAKAPVTPPASTPSPAAAPAPAPSPVPAPVAATPAAPPEPQKPAPVATAAPSTPKPATAPAPTPPSVAAPAVTPMAPAAPAQPLRSSSPPSMQPLPAPSPAPAPAPTTSAPAPAAPLLAPVTATAPEPSTAPPAAAPAAPPPVVSPPPAVAAAAPIARSCFECAPGESALAVAATVAAGGTSCAAGGADRLRSSPLGALDAVRLELGSGCALLRVDLPRGARYTGFRYEAEGPNGRAADCLPGKECPSGASRFVGEPVIRREGDLTTVLGLFESAAERRGTLTVYWTRSKK